MAVSFVAPLTIFTFFLSIWINCSSNHDPNLVNDLPNKSGFTISISTTLKVGKQAFLSVINRKSKRSVLFSFVLKYCQA